MGIVSFLQNKHLIYSPNHSRLRLLVVVSHEIVCGWLQNYPKIEAFWVLKIFEWYMRQHLFTHSFVLLMVILLNKAQGNWSSVSSDTSKQKDIKSQINERYMFSIHKYFLGSCLVPETVKGDDCRKRSLDARGWLPLGKMENNDETKKQENFRKTQVLWGK